MSAEIRKIDAEPIGKSVIERLELFLEMAKKGEISSIAIAAVLRDGSPQFHWSDASSYSALIGSIERMKYRMISQND